MNSKSIRNLIVRTGHTKSILFISVASVLFSEVVTLVFLLLIPQGDIIMRTRLLVALSIAGIVPLIVAPVVSWALVGLILEIDALEEKMRGLATYDSLTGLLNRQAFLEQAGYGCRITEREGLSFSVLVLDLDYFKQINDRYGHAMGDRILETFGKVAGAIARQSDLAGRIGGEEFAFFLSNTSAEQAWSLAERLHQAIRRTSVEVNGTPVQFTVSIGLVSFSGPVQIEKALRLADRALYIAKEKGRNQTAVFEADVSSGSEGVSLQSK